jgi:hypothetical protein
MGAFAAIMIGIPVVMGLSFQETVTIAIISCPRGQLITCNPPLMENPWSSIMSMTTNKPGKKNFVQNVIGNSTENRS